MNRTKAQKQEMVTTLATQVAKSQTIYVTDFTGLNVAHITDLRRRLRAVGVEYVVVKNTLARRAAEGTAIEGAAEHFKGVTAVALSTGDPVGLSKAISKFTKANPDIFTFKAGVVEGRVVALREVEAIASLPSREELISKVMFLINCQAQRLVTELSAVPRNLAVVIKQIGEQKTA